MDRPPDRLALTAPNLSLFDDPLVVALHFRDRPMSDRHATPDGETLIRIGDLFAD